MATQNSAENGGARSRRAGHNGHGGSGAHVGEIVRAARDQAVALIGRPVEAISAIERTDDGWIVTVEVVEMERIPPTTSVLGSYEVEVDASGDVEGLRRMRRYYRNQAGEL